MVQRTRKRRVDPRGNDYPFIPFVFVHYQSDQRVLVPLAELDHAGALSGDLFVRLLERENRDTSREFALLETFEGVIGPYDTPILVRVRHRDIVPDAPSCYTEEVTRVSRILGQQSLVLIFLYAPAGLGHLRVTDALYGGLSNDVFPILLGSHDENIKFLHRAVSIHPILRRIFEWAQHGPQQYFFTDIYYFLTRLRTGLIYQQMETLLDQRINTPDTVLLVATHYGLAHQLGVIKERLQRDKKVKVILAVQVTDDSPQYMWYVPEADIMFVPSRYTKEQLEEYGRVKGYDPVRTEVVAYPVSPKLAYTLDRAGFHEKAHQVEPDSKSQIHVSVPISGAAVGLEFVTNLLDKLYQHSHRFAFHVVTRSAPYTIPFLSQMIERPYVTLYVSAQDRDVVNAYEQIYRKHKISLEITKPSEQSFKALLTPKQGGGSILLFSTPVGRQEYDNINFLRRHRMIPSLREQRYLWELSEKNLKPVSERACRIIEQAGHWRGQEIPGDPRDAARFIWWCSRNGIFSTMMDWTPDPRLTPEELAEISPEGVKTFWERVAEYIATNDTFA
jgi:hypothetical protein